MDDEKKKIIDGEVIEGTITGRLVTRKPEEQRIVSLEKLRQVHDEVFDVDFSDIEERLLNTYAGQFIGVAFNPKQPCGCSVPGEEGTFTPRPGCPEHDPPPTGNIILTDKD